ncbi:MAG: prephenate dehydrogenase [Candidatus Glassbacteria bacterium]|nr:prephenate dehydrogenase [Candidatus Glassbacteria bacterium]
MSTAKNDKDAGPFYGTMAVFGVGLIGGSLALASKRGRLVERVLGISRASTVEKALELGVIDQGFERERAAEALEQADLVVLAGPVQVIISQLGTIGPLLKAGATVTDVGSTKRAIVKAALENLPETAHFVGGHPMAGAETTGVESADPFLFQNAVYVICPGRETDREQADRFSSLAQAIGARVLITTPENHDRIAATISHLPQLVAVGMMNLAAQFNDEDDDTLKLAAGGFRDLTRIASSPFDMWRDILATNSDELRDRIDSLIRRLEALKDVVGTEEMARSFERAARSRALIHKDLKGFLTPLFEAIVTAPDEVGVILRIANGLAGEQINIKDIEVLKVREGEGGTIKLGFSTVEDRAGAIRILKALGFPARSRD